MIPVSEESDPNFESSTPKKKTSSKPQATSRQPSKRQSRNKIARFLQAMTTIQQAFDEHRNKSNTSNRESKRPFEEFLKASPSITSDYRVPRPSKQILLRYLAEINQQREVGGKAPIVLKFYQFDKDRRTPSKFIDFPVALDSHVKLVNDKEYEKVWNWVAKSSAAADLRGADSEVLHKIYLSHPALKHLIPESNELVLRASPTIKDDPDGKKIDEISGPEL